MSDYFKDEGLVLRVKTFKEADGIIVFFGKNYGKFYGLVKNIKKSLKNISLFDQSHYLKIFGVFYQNKVKIISGLVLKELTILDENLQDWLWALKVVDKILPIRKTEENIFNLLIVSSLILQKPVKYFRSWFLIKILYFNGLFSLNFSCLQCNNNLTNFEKIYFYNGWYCSRCQTTGINLKPRELYLLAKLVYSPYPLKITPNIIKLVKTLSQNFI